MEGELQGEHRWEADERERGGERLTRVGDGESAGGAVVGDREAKKFGGNGMGFGVV